MTLLAEQPPAPPTLLATAVSNHHVGDPKQPRGNGRLALKAGQARAGNGENLVNGIL